MTLKELKKQWPGWNFSLWPAWDGKYGAIGSRGGQRCIHVEGLVCVSKSSAVSSLHGYMTKHIRKATNR